MIECNEIMKSISYLAQIDKQFLYVMYNVECIYMTVFGY